jgi:hypothetical protein
MSREYFSNVGDTNIKPFSGQSGSGYAPSSQRGRVQVANPNNPSELIWVDARPDAYGDLVPVDPRYNARLGYVGTQAPTINNFSSAGSSSAGILLLVVGAVVLFAVVNR